MWREYRGQLRSGVQAHTVTEVEGSGAANLGCGPPFRWPSAGFQPASGDWPFPLGQIGNRRKLTHDQRFHSEREGAFALWPGGASEEVMCKIVTRGASPKTANSPARYRDLWRILSASRSPINRSCRGQAAAPNGRSEEH